MTGRAGAAALVLALVAAGCGAAGSGDDADLDYCLGRALDRAAEITEDYNAGRLDPASATKVFLDRHGVNTAIIPANYDVAHDEPERCGWLDDEGEPEAGG